MTLHYAIEFLKNTSPAQRMTMFLGCIIIVLVVFVLVDIYRKGF